MPRPVNRQGTRGEDRPPRLRVGFILARHFTLCAFANFVDVLRLAADEGDRSRPILCRWSVLSDTMGPVASSCGVAVQPNARLSDPRDFDYVVVVGGLVDEMDTLSAGTVAFLRQAAAARIPLVGVCTGALILHRVGLMDGYRCCVSWFHHADFLEQFEGLVPVSDRIYVIDRDRLTCSGGASSAHLAAHLVAQHVGGAAAHKSLRIMIIDQVQAGETSQPGTRLDLTTTDEVAKRAMLQMHRNIEAPLSVAEVARRVGMSRGGHRLLRHVPPRPRLEAPPGDRPDRAAADALTRGQRASRSSPRRWDERDKAGPLSRTSQENARRRVWARTWRAPRGGACPILLAYRASSRDQVTPPDRDLLQAAETAPGPELERIRRRRTRFGCRTSSTSRSTPRAGAAVRPRGAPAIVDRAP